ncbi:MAG: hypothetical protein K1X47_15520 [Cyclobacteriaceae bacterium]|nr:hypothetical protein [Cyclobacteriaceae bacterium]
MRYWWSLFIVFVLWSCATYYQTNYAFNAAFEQGQLDQALTTLQSRSSEGKGKAAFLYDVNNGLILSMKSRYQESNDYFEKAFLFGEDYRINYLNEVASYLTNPMFTVYKGEDHEHLLVPYYKALNYLKMGNIDDALVECRRMNIRLQQLSDRYTSNNKYRRDAFIHNLMGIIYDASHDYNNAFIAYRNAWEIYQEDYGRLFGVQAPSQLREDLLRTAWLTGLTAEFDRLRQEVGLPDYRYQAGSGGELVFFWHNGLAPVKSEWSINFFIERRGNQMIFFNEQLASLAQAGIALDGSVISINRKANSKYYQQKDITVSDIFAGRVKAPGPGTRELLEEISRATAAAPGGGAAGTAAGNGQSGTNPAAPAPARTFPMEDAHPGAEPR